MSGNNNSLYPVVQIDKRTIDRNKLLPDDLAHQIKGKTLEVYYFLVTQSGKYGVREIQRELNYSSPSLAAYHLDRLLNFKLVNKTNDGKYFVDGDIEELGELQRYIVVMGTYIPKILLYSYQAFLSIFVAIFFWVFDVRPFIWMIYFVGSSVLFFAILLRDAIQLRARLDKNERSS